MGIGMTLGVGQRCVSAFAPLLTWKTAQCLKITEKVAFYIASEASYVYILSAHKFIKNAKKGYFGEFLKT